MGNGIGIHLVVCPHQLLGSLKQLKHDMYEESSTTSAHTLCRLVVEFERPQGESGVELGDRGQGDEELFRCSQGNVRGLHLCLNDLPLFLFRREHRC